MSWDNRGACGACKLMRRKCTQDCIFAPYFPSIQPQKFEAVHRVYGASNVSKLLQELQPSQRQDAVDSLVYEAESRIRDPVYGCVGLVYILQQRLKHIRRELEDAKRELATYIGPQAMIPMGPQQPPSMAPQPQLGLGQPSSSISQQPQNMVPRMDIPTAQPHELLFLRDHPLHHQPQQQILEAQQLAPDVAVREQQQHQHQYQELFRAYGGGHHQNQQDQQQVEILRLFDTVPGSTTTVCEINQMSSTATALSPSLTIGSIETPANETHQYQLLNQRHPHEAQLFIPLQHAQPQQQQ